MRSTFLGNVFNSAPETQVNAGELGRRGHNLDFLVAETYGEEETSILMVAELWRKNVSAYIGPQETCIHEGRMAAAFNIPMISYVNNNFQFSHSYFVLCNLCNTNNSFAIISCSNFRALLK